ETLHLYGGPQTSSTVPYIFRASSRASDCSNISAWSRDRMNIPSGSFAGPVLSMNISTISPLAESVTEATTTCFSNMGVTPYRDTHLHFVAVEWGSRPPQQESDGEGQGEGRHSDCRADDPVSQSHDHRPSRSSDAACALSGVRVPCSMDSGIPQLRRVKSGDIRVTAVTKMSPRHPTADLSASPQRFGARTSSPSKSPRS